MKPEMHDLSERLSELGVTKSALIFKLFIPMLLLLMVLLIAITYLLLKGTVVWGINIPVAWGFAIINFVWWVGIGHAGTFISAVLLLARQEWRSSINRLAESMTLFAVACAGIFPLLHMGRPWFAYWLLPYPNDMTLIPQYRSPLVWDAFAVTTYLTVSVIFWYVGLIPDFAIAREKTNSKAKQIIFGVLSLGFSGEAREWLIFKKASLLLALIATPLVVSVHTVVSLDFASAGVSGWHSAIFPPFFVIGAIYSGFAMVICMLILLRHKFKIEDLITERHIERSAKLLLMSGTLVTFFYITEFFMAWFGEEYYEIVNLVHRATGEKAWAFWTMLFCNSIAIQLLWIPKFRRNEKLLFVVCIFVLIGMWMERYVIVITSLMDSYLPSGAGNYSPTIWDWLLYLGTFGLFGFGMLFVIRFLPFIPITEVKECKEDF
ncbi:NrfD/PsrC family molybdoenzyme membrane anchor subunit [Peredibacter starrii]|uniref:NrfD/PsrC family molybdoenzyme membrane anchor subunit n=1 Tax=Peredibacter starrii TaxID=28202 RepID=A0AAX4HRS8_9BACT|nr:NrfD/PsrC family molybdoenzyme membrane anchor subunit [Peredibacter starrii]WPU66070.1 NrfD/PsrC family molybdoenzyme membrane anchor subunit [Peredibacter starrii]